MTGENVLQAIADVQWVVGSFVGSAEGELLFYQMPEEFGEQELVRTTSRLANIVRCAEFCDLNVDQCNLSLSRYQLVMKRFDGGVLCVMVEAPVSKRALNMAMRLALDVLPDTVEELLSDWEASAMLDEDTKVELPRVTDANSPQAEMEV